MKTLNVAIAARNLAARGRSRKAKAPARKPRGKGKPGVVELAWEAAVGFTQEKKQELLGLLYLLAGSALTLALVPKDPNFLGRAGWYLFRFCFGALGVSCVLLPAGLILLGFNGLRQQELRAPTVKATGWALIAVSVAVLLNLAVPDKIAGGVAMDLYWGGLLGRLLGSAAQMYLATAGTVVLCMALLAVAVYLLEQEALVKMAFLRAYERVRLWQLGFKGAEAPRARARAPRVAEVDEEEAPRKGRKARPEAAMETAQAPSTGSGQDFLAEEEEADLAMGSDESEDPSMDAGQAIKLKSAKDREDIAARFLKERHKIKVSQGGPRVNAAASTEALKAGTFQAHSTLQNYELPSASLLKEATATLSAPKDYEEVSANLERVLTSFGVAAKVVEVCPGPSVTRYEIALAPGVKMSRVVSLADDIALGAKASAVRIEGPIPGKGTLGVEIPNAKSVPVLMRELVETEEFNAGGHKLIFALGKDIGGSMIFSNLAEMPHLMVAGATGSGKSVCLNAIITSILFRAAPDEVKFLMVDPKRVELTPYDGIPHLMRPVVANPKEAAGALRLMVEEMEDRYKLLASAGMRKIDDYNEWVAAREEEKRRSPVMEEEVLEEVPKEKDPHHRLPYIVVIVDELADLMMVSANEVESSICRLAQMARGVGIHLVIATQRPSVDVITGVIKANLPSRIAFQVSSKIDSRTILDGSGAEALLGRGDMLYSPYNVNKPIRVQGCFLSGT
ncbi:MAG TPA: DNA translocase FtsK 4TM domain-containing protein, partial [bacterium]|nr:DNA translocase FtsK 4TM domain-containing protein [bacterium]